MLKGLMAGLTVLLVLPAVAAADGYELERRWAADRASALAVGAGGVFVLSSAADRVTRYSARGRRVAAWSGDLERPGAIAVAPGGNVYVADAGRRMAIFDGAGRALGGGPLMTPAGEPELAWDIDVDVAGETFVAFYGNALTPPVIARYDARGRGLGFWGSGTGAGPGQFRGSLSIASDGRGNVYVADTGEHRVQRFSTTGALLGQWGRLGSAPGELHEPHGIAVDRRGDVYVADESNNRVQKFDPRGRVQAVIDLRPYSIASDPVDVAVDARGRVYVADRGNPERVYVFGPVSCREARGKVSRAQRTLRRLRARDAAPRRVRSARRAVGEAKRLRRAAC